MTRLWTPLCRRCSTGNPNSRSSCARCCSWSHCSGSSRDLGRRRLDRSMRSRASGTHRFLHTRTGHSWKSTPWWLWSSALSDPGNTSNLAAHSSSTKRRCSLLPTYASNTDRAGQVQNIGMPDWTTGSHFWRCTFHLCRAHCTASASCSPLW